MVFQLMDNSTLQYSTLSLSDFLLGWCLVMWAICWWLFPFWSILRLMCGRGLLFFSWAIVVLSITSSLGWILVCLRVAIIYLNHHQIPQWYSRLRKGSLMTVCIRLELIQPGNQPKTKCNSLTVSKWNWLLFWESPTWCSDWLLNLSMESGRRRGCNFSPLPSLR